ncbi:MAG: methyltransferase domain-containing protein [Verrucomicrobiales bacterium]|nr:methyltransferase domain-containing protein [Verrucomicrobiales bacterium]
MPTPTDWEERYRTGDMPWEKGEGSPGLSDFLSQHPDLPRGSVVVPGCGTGHDVRLWARFGFEAVGIDIAPSAVQLCEAKTQALGLSAHFRVADFLRDPPFLRFDWIFEHTLFCAIEKTDRDAYVDAVLRWLKPGGQFLAVHYMLRDGQGPPFGCAQEELMERFLPHFELLEGRVPRSYPNRTGLELLLWWKRRADSVPSSPG